MSKLEEKIARHKRMTAMVENMRRNFGSGISPARENQIRKDPSMFIDRDGNVIKLDKRIERKKTEETLAEMRWNFGRDWPKYGTPDDGFDTYDDWLNDKKRLACNYN